jgi:hypothetical protein
VTRVQWLLTITFGIYALAVTLIGIGHHRRMTQLGYRLSKYWTRYELK